jgi:cell division protein FtsB
MELSTVITIGVNMLFALLMFIFQKLFIERLDKLQQSFEKMADKLEQYVKIQDHKEDMYELTKRVEKNERDIELLKEDVIGLKIKGN